MNFKILTLSVLTSVAFASCSDDFLQDKKSYDKVNEDAYNYYEGALGRLADAYMLCLPDDGTGPSYMNVSTGSSDEQSQATEEYCGFSTFVNPEKTVGTDGNYGVPDYFQGQTGNIRYNAWGRLRNVNDVIRGISGSSLPESQKNELLGQAYFLRAWCYYNFVRWYGGVPIITEVQEPTEDAFVPRSSTKDCIDFICSDLDKANEMLAPFTTNGGWAESGNFGRATSGTALALKGRVLLLWASPLFNRANDPERWNNAYEVIKASIPVINSCGYGLAYEGTPGVNASNWAKMFVENTTEEGVFVVLHNNLVMPGPGAPDYRKWCAWEAGIRPSNTTGTGGKVPSAMLVDMFPMKDGKRPATANVYNILDASSLTYDQALPFMDRDPRFYRTYAFPGVRWAFNGDPRDPENHNVYDGKDYQLWNYVWYTSEADRNNIESGKNYGPDGLMDNVKGLYVRKRTDDFDVNPSPLYVFDKSNNGFKQSATPYLEIRYAEVLLNYAEAACGAGHMAEAVEQLKKIRQRVGYTGDCGLQSSLSSDQAACMAAVLYERQIELAFEGKRFEDMRRWMLFDGGANQPAGTPSTWKLTGWNGNTCTYLGFPPMNGQRRENLEFRVKADYNNGLGKDSWNNDLSHDPIGSVARPAALDYRQPLDDQLETLKAWYNDYLERNTKKGDAYDSSHAPLKIDFKPTYYIMGLSSGVHANNVGLMQTAGWNDYYHGGMGTFDPLAE